MHGYFQSGKYGVGKCILDRLAVIYFVFPIMGTNEAIFRGPAPISQLSLRFGKMLGFQKGFVSIYEVKSNEFRCTDRKHFRSFCMRSNSENLWLGNKGAIQ